MPRFARIVDGRVMEIVSAPKLPPFHPDIARQFRQVPTSIQEGWIEVDGVLQAPPAPPAPDYRQRRAAEYPSIGDQLDAIWKQINHDRLNGKDLVAEADHLLNDYLAVKARHPKPDEEEA